MDASPETAAGKRLEGELPENKACSQRMARQRDAKNLGLQWRSDLLNR